MSQRAVTTQQQVCNSPQLTRGEMLFAAPAHDQNISPALRLENGDLDYVRAHPQHETLQGQTDRQTDPHLHLLQHRMVFYPREENPHGVGAVIQKGYASPVQVVGQLVNVRLQLSKGWGGKRRNN